MFTNGTGEKRKNYWLKWLAIIYVQVEFTGFTVKTGKMIIKKLPIYLEMNKIYAFNRQKG